MLAGREGSILRPMTNLWASRENTTEPTLTVSRLRCTLQHFPIRRRCPSSHSRIMLPYRGWGRFLSRLESIDSKKDWKRATTDFEEPLAAAPTAALTVLLV